MKNHVKKTDDKSMGSKDKKKPVKKKMDKGIKY